MDQGLSRLRAVARTVTTIVMVYAFGLAAVNVRATIPWTSHLFPVLGQRIDHTSVDQAFAIVQSQYVVRAVDGHKGSEGAAKGLIAALQSTYNDRFSQYLTASEAASLHSRLAGQRGGSVGIALDAQCAGQRCGEGKAPDGVVISQVLRNQPADKAGVRLRDQLSAIDGVALSAIGASPDAQIAGAADRIRGKAGTTVRLTLRRGESVRDVVVQRADLFIPSVFTQRFGPTLYMQITGFDESTGRDAKAQLKRAVEGGATGVVLDMRGNGGGYVTAAQTVASQFVAPIPGKQEDVVVRRGRLDSSQDPGTATKVEHDKIEPGGVALTIKVVALVDGDSASASEIVTACLHDYHRATVLGVKTFGKGSVQEDFALSDGGDLHLTVEKWYGPAGGSIDYNGIVPDRVVALPSADVRFRLDSQGPEAAGDPQLQGALSVLTG